MAAGVLADRPCFQQQRVVNNDDDIDNNNINNVNDGNDDNHNDNKRQQPQQQRCRSHAPCHLKKKTQANERLAECGGCSHLLQSPPVKPIGPARPELRVPCVQSGSCKLGTPSTLCASVCKSAAVS